MSGLKTGLSITGLLVFGTTTSLFAKIGEFRMSVRKVKNMFGKGLLGTLH